MTKILCIYHGNCADGFGAAWAVRHALRDGVEFHAGFYGNAPPDVAGRDVVLVDFSYKRPVIIEMAKAARSLLIIDHHKTAAEDLEGLMRSPPGGWPTWMENGPLYDDEACYVDPPLDRVAALFDMNRSGAGLAWDYFHPRQPRPALIDHIEDRDLWRFKLPGTRESRKYARVITRIKRLRRCRG